MRKQSILSLLVCGAFASFLFMSCTDTDYDLDKLNKDAVFSPDGISVPIGSLDTIWLEKLQGVEIKSPESITITLSDTLKDLFTEDLIKHVFNTGTGSGDVVIVSTCDAHVESDLKVVAKAHAVNEDGDVINDVKIEVEPVEGLTNKKNQPFSITIKKEYMQHMSKARHLELNFVLTGKQVKIEEGDFVFLKDVKIKKKGGVYFKF